MAAARLRVSVATPDSRLTRREALRRGRPVGEALGRGWRSIAPAKARGDLSVAIVSDRRMRALNRQFRGKDKVTDVLSFPSTSAARLSRRYRDCRRASRSSRRKAAGHSVQTEMRVLALHGLLHLLGYDHESDDGTMARVEARLRKKAGLKEG